MDVSKVVLLVVFLFGDRPSKAPIGDRSVRESSIYARAASNSKIPEKWLTVAIVFLGVGDVKQPIDGTGKSTFGLPE